MSKRASNIAKGRPGWSFQPPAMARPPNPPNWWAKGEPTHPGPQTRFFFTFLINFKLKIIKINKIFYIILKNL